MRFQSSIDSFRFTLLHEIGHRSERDKGSYLAVLEGGATQGGPVQDASEDGEETPEPGEDRANRMACDWLPDPDAYSAFVATNRARFSKARIETFAREQRRHPGIVLGRLQRDGWAPYKSLRGLLVKVSPYLQEYIQE